MGEHRESGGMLERWSCSSRRGWVVPPRLTYEAAFEARLVAWLMRVEAALLAVS